MLLKMIIHLQSNNLENFAKENNLWDGKEKLNFAETFQESITMY